MVEQGMALLRVRRLEELSAQEYGGIISRSAGSYEAIMPAVAAAMQTVKSEGDAALVAANERAYGPADYRPLRVSAEEIQQAYGSVSADVVEAIQHMIRNVRAVHAAQLPTKKEHPVYPDPGIAVWREWRPIDTVGLYVPGGKAVYPSSVIMSTVPAQIAGCREIILCSPPRQNGRIPAVTLVAADQLGLTQLYKIGGAEAIAAMTYGTESVPAVHKIFGAGSAYVTAAKMLARNIISIDMPAGPSEVFIIADQTAIPAYIAADLLADGEHAEDSACVLVTTSEEVARDTLKEIEAQLVTLPTADRARASLEQFGLFAVVETLDEAIAFSNEYAPEHLHIMVEDPDTVLQGIRHAGSVFLGPWTAKAAGDYATGANHVLPTGGMAKMYPPLGVDSYGKWMQVQRCMRDGLAGVRQTIETIADVEQLPAHKHSVTVRFQNEMS